jgi:Uma2 family endonuclease
MIASKSRGPYFTPEEYLQLERISLVKHEYRQGLVIAMAGASKAHVAINMNLSGLLFNHLRSNAECAFYGVDMKVRLSKVKGFYYPDLVVTCDEADQRSVEGIIDHPKLIIEILSDSTEAFDREDKFSDYKTIPALEEYVLVHQKQILVERFLLRDRFWVAEIYRAGEQVEFASIEFVCPIEFLYEGARQSLEVKG